MQVQKDVFNNFSLPKSPEFMLVATFIPAYMGADNPTHVGFYHKIEDMREDVEKLERGSNVSDIYIAHVVKEHRNVHR